MFSNKYRERAAKLGIDVEHSYRLLLFEIRVGGPVYQRLCDSLDGRDRRNYESGTVSTIVQKPTALTLTERELEVLQLCANGYTAPEIATALWLSADTVRDHTRHIRDKLGANNTTHAVAIAISDGLISLERHAA